VAKRIHDLSKRSSRPFISIDCGALSKELAASELFGHIKGSFTGAITDKTGQFEAAKGGTLFLDEIGNLSYEIQIQLLRALQERKVRKIGSNHDVEVDVRILTATNEDLIEAVKRGDFREDLYHRLNEFRILVPSLKQRPEDIAAFCKAFLQLANQELDKHLQSFDEEVLDIFSKYTWPGNLRELRNVIRRAALLSKGEVVLKEALPAEIIEESYFSANKVGDVSSATDLKSVAGKTERDLIIQTLTKVNFNKSKAAQLLKIDRKTLYNKMKQYNIE
jgi:two-component system response regulator HydG